VLIENPATRSLVFCRSTRCSLRKHTSVNHNSCCLLYMDSRLEKSERDTEREREREARGKREPAARAKRAEHSRASVNLNANSGKQIYFATTYDSPKRSKVRQSRVTRRAHTRMHYSCPKPTTTRPAVLARNRTFARNKQSMGNYRRTRLICERELTIHR